MSIGATTPITPQVLGVPNGSAPQAGLPADPAALETQIMQLGTALITLVEQLQPGAAGGNKKKATPSLGDTARNYAQYALSNSDTGYKYKPIQSDDSGWWDALGYSEVG